MTPSAAGPRATPESAIARWRGPADGLAAVTLAAAVAVVYGGILRLWWTVDDLFILRLLSIHPAPSYLFSRSAWSLAPQMFTPLQFLSYGLDLAFFGRRPAGFHAHHLLALAAATLAVYFALRQWLRPRYAWFGGMLFLLSIPTASWAVELPCRHYVEGMVWAALAVAFFARSARGAGRGAAGLAAGLSVLFYFLAILEKEIYIPVIALLPALSEGPAPVRLRRIAPHAAALLLYMAWRWAMLGTLLGGYGWTVDPQELPGLVARLPLAVARTLGSADVAADAVLAACLLLGLSVLVARRPRSLAWLAAGAVLALAPIVPVAKAIGERFGAILWLVLAVGFVFGCRELARLGGRSAAASGISLGLLVATLAAAALVQRADWRGRFGDAEEMSAEGRFFLEMKPGDLLRRPRVPPAAMQETRWLKEQLLKLPAGSGWFADDVYLCRPERPSGRIWQYDRAARRMRDVTDAALAEAARYCAGVRSAPLSARFESSQESLRWSLGPYARGQYALVFDRGVQCVPVRREDGYRTSPDRLSVQVRYQAPEGWVTYSPPLFMDFRTASRFHWERGKAMP